MKKIALCAALCGLAAAAAFAQNVTLDIGGYAKTFWIPYRLSVLGSDEVGGSHKAGDVLHTTAVQVPWGGPNLCAGVNFDGRSEFGGLHLAVDIASYTSGVEADAKISGWAWVRPFDFIPYFEMFKIYAGEVYDQTLMGTIGSSDLVQYVIDQSWNGMHRTRLDYREGAYNIFTPINPYRWGNAFRDSSQRKETNLLWPWVWSSAMITWEPVRNLFIGFWVAPKISLMYNRPPDKTFPDTRGDIPGIDDIDADYYDAVKVYRRMQISAGYTIPGIGFIRLQYIGMRNVIEAAYQVLSIPGLNIDAGFKIPFEGNDPDDTDTYLRINDYQISAAASWRYSDFRLTGRVDTAFGGYNRYGNLSEVQVHGLNLIAYLIPSYQFKHGTVGVDLGFEYEAKDNYNRFEQDGMKAGAAVWFYRHLGNARFKAALSTRLPLVWHQGKQNLEVYIPLFIETGF